MTQIAMSDHHSVRILYTAISNRINLTGITTKVYRRYRIPKVRLENWKRMLGLAEAVS